MTLNEIIKQINANKFFSKWNRHNNITYTSPVSDLLVGLFFERVKSNLYIWRYTQPLIVKKENHTLLFSNRVKLSTISISEFNVEESISAIINACKDIPLTIESLIINLYAKKELTYEEKIDFYLMKTYLNSRIDIDDREQDKKFIEIFGDLSDLREFEKEIYNNIVELLSKTSLERRTYFFKILEKNKFDLGSQ